MNILLINPPQPYMVVKHTQAPLGLLYLSAIIKRERKINVEILDLSDCLLISAVSMVKDRNPDVCGFTATTLDYLTCLKMLILLKETLRSTHFIIGGIHATVCAESMVEDGWTSIFRGEADLTVLNFIDDISEKNSPKKIYDSERVNDINFLPYPDRDAIDWLGGTVLAKGNKTSINIIASRGCYRNCAFCASKSMWGGNVRWREPEDVFNEICHCIDKYDEHIFRFSDDNMLSNKRWAEKFCKLVKPLNIKWRMSVRVDDVSPEILDLLYGAGCIELGFGVESFDNNVLGILKKKIVAKQSINAIEMTHDANIGSRILLMINTPGETYRHTVDKNIEALERLRDKFVYLSVKPLVPFPGTDIWNNPDEFGVEIKTRDFSKYNMWMYSLDEDGNKVCTEKSVLSIKNMSEGEQLENLVRMRRYTETLPVTQRG